MIKKERETERQREEKRYQVPSPLSPSLSLSTPTIRCLNFLSLRRAFLKSLHNHFLFQDGETPVFHFEQRQNQLLQRTQKQSPER